MRDEAEGLGQALEGHGWGGSCAGEIRGGTEWGTRGTEQLLSSSTFPTSQRRQTGFACGYCINLQHPDTGQSKQQPLIETDDKHI